MKNPRELAPWKLILILILMILAFLFYYGCTTSAYYATAKHGWCIPLVCALGVIDIVLYSCWTRFSEKSWTISLNLRKLPIEILKGIGLGIVYFAIVTLIIALTGCYKVVSVSFPTGLYSQLALFFAVACGEEIVFRGILFRLLDLKWGLTTALIVSSVTFGFAHFFSDGATVWSCLAIAIEAGLLLGMAFKFSGTLWFPIGIHWAWNFVEGPVLGFGVSGTETESIFHPLIKGPEIITGGVFGAEASIIAAVTGLLIAFWLWYKYEKREGKKFTPDNTPNPEFL